MSKKFSFHANEEHDGKRLDAVITTQKVVASRSQVKHLIDESAVLIDGKPAAKAGQKIHKGQSIDITIPDPKKLDLTPQNVNIKIIHEDEDLAVLEKPAGISVHPSDTETEPTVVHGLLFKLKTLSKVGGVERPGIVHRIDKGTSGLLVVSKTDEAHHHLSEQFQSHTVIRKYKALVFGNLSKKGISGRIETKFGRNPSHRKKMTGKVTSGKDAITNWKILKDFERLTLVECKLETGRTHQIRVHLSELGFSVVGDPLYGDHKGKAKALENLNKKLSIQCLQLDHQLLHAASMEFTHPKTGKKMSFSSDLPEDFQVVLDSIPK